MNNKQAFMNYTSREKKALEVLQTRNEPKKKKKQFQKTINARHHHKNRRKKRKEKL